MIPDNLLPIHDTIPPHDGNIPYHRRQHPSPIDDTFPHPSTTIPLTPSTTPSLTLPAATSRWCTGRGETPLHYAGFFGIHPVAEVLLGAAHPDQQDSEGITPVHWAALQGL
jgi:hypothetical protein